MRYKETITADRQGPLALLFEQPFLMSSRKLDRRLSGSGDRVAIPVFKITNVSAPLRAHSPICLRTNEIIRNYQNCNNFRFAV